MARNLVDLLKENGYWKEPKTGRRPTSPRPTADRPTPAPRATPVPPAKPAPIAQDAFPDRPKHYWLFVFVGVLTALSWIDNAAEFFIGSPGPFGTFDLTHVYLFFLALYAGTKEISKGLRPAPVAAPDARLIKGECFVVLWGMKAALMCLAAKWSHRYQVPADLPLLIKGVGGIFFGGFGAKTYREWLTGPKTPAAPRARAAGADASGGEASAAAKDALIKKIEDYLWTLPKGATRKEIEAAMEMEKWDAIHVLQEMIKDGLAVKLEKRPGDAETRYTVPAFQELKG